MTSRRRTKARRASTPHRVQRGHLLPPSDDDGTGFTLGWAASDADIPEVHQATHDTLIALMGRRRSSGVSWNHFTGDGALGALHELIASTTSEEHLHVYRRIRGMLREYGGILVIATATGRRDA